jgi:RNA polymerase sigma-70 factor (ECF subfamily)
MQRSSDTVLDELFVLQAQGGDAEALSALIERWQSRVFRRAVLLTGRHDLAADVAQESWLAVARGIRRLEDPACFPRWVLQIVARKSTDAVRDQVRQRKLNERAAAGKSEATARAKPELNEDLGGLRRAMSNLPTDRRTLLSMYYWDGKSVAEIAHVMSIPLGTVKSRLHHARQELKQFLERNTP